MTVAVSDADARTPRASSWVLAVVSVALVVLGIVSTRIGFGSFQFRIEILTLLTGWIVAALGLALWRRAPASRVGPMLCLAAAAWFVPGFKIVAWGPAASLAHGVYLLWAPVLGVAVLGYANGRLTGRWTHLAAAATLVVALIPSPRQELTVGVVLGAGIIGSWILRRHERLPGLSTVLSSGLLLCLVLATWRALPGLLALGGSFDATPILQGAVVVCAATLTAMVSQLRGRRRRVTDLVLELGPGAGQGLTGELRHLLDDPTFRIGLWLAPESAYVEPEGGPFVESDASGSRITDLNDGGVPVARLVQVLPGLVLDEQLRQGIARSARLASANAALHADLRAQIGTLRASKERIMTAGEQERAALRRRLEGSLEPQLAALERVLRDMPAKTGGVSALLDEVDGTRHDLFQLARGLGPQPGDGTGVGPAVEVLVERCPIPVLATIAVRVEPDRTRGACLLFVIGEALTNIARHSDARSVQLELAIERQAARLTITDDGRGGADPARGSGLSGLQERVRALGGDMTLWSQPGRGTRLDVSLPLTASADRPELSPVAA